jgi:hypothetical protein
VQQSPNRPSLPASYPRLIISGNLITIVGELGVKAQDQAGTVPLGSLSVSLRVGLTSGNATRTGSSPVKE